MKFKKNLLDKKGQTMKDFGCSGFTWETEDKKHLLGRTYDQFGNLEGNGIAVVPRGERMRLEIDSLSESYCVTQYAFTGMAVTGLDTPIMVDGINEKGLMGALLNFPAYADYGAQISEREISVHPGFLITFLLGTCGSLEDVEAALKKVRLTEELIFGHTMSVHYMVSDESGRSMVIEPDRNGMSVHRDSIGVLTNSPGYEWHLTNLCNYMEVDNLPKEPRILNGMQVAVFGEKQGGTMGLPGDYTSPSRFVRLAFVKHYAVKGKDEVDGVGRMFHAFAPVDIPAGIISAGDKHSDGSSSDKKCSDKRENSITGEDYEMTLCSTVMCAESRTYYFSVAGNRRICAVRLTRELDNKEIRYFALPKEQDIDYLN